jgi:hypothetical protein
MNPKGVTLIAVFIAILAVLCFGTTLGDLACSLKAGEWAVLNTVDDGSGFTEQFMLSPGGSGASGYITGYADDGHWDPVRGRYLYFGAGHWVPWRFITYSDTTGKWTTLSDPPFGHTHTYDNLAFDPAGRRLYYCVANNGTGVDLRVYDVDTDQWLANVPRYSISDYLDNHGGAVFFPELGGVVVVNGSGGSGFLYFYDVNSKQWSTLASNLSMGNMHNFIEYSPVHKVLIVGGGNGSRNVYIVDSDKNVTAHTAPVGLGVTDGVLTVDPVSGDFLVFVEGGNYAFNPITKSWNSISGHPLFLDYCYNPDPYYAISTYVSTYGINMFLTWGYSRSAVVIYKHSTTQAGCSQGEIEAASLNKEDVIIQVSPNPFNLSTTFKINCRLKSVDCRFKIYDINGKMADDLTSKIKNQQSSILNQITWNPSNQPPGIYLLKLKIGNQQYSKKLILQR